MVGKRWSKFAIAVAVLATAVQTSPAAAEEPASPAPAKKSMFMDIYAASVRAHMDRYGTTKEQIGKVALLD